MAAPPTQPHRPPPRPSPAWRALARRRRAAGRRCAGYHKGSKNHNGHKVFWGTPKGARRRRAAGRRCAGYHKGSKNHNGHKVFWGTPEGGRWKLGSLEAWPPSQSLGRQVRHVADVLRVQGELPPAGVQGAEPFALPIPIPHFPFPLCALCALCDFQPPCPSAWPLWPLWPLWSSPASSFLRVLCDFRSSFAISRRPRVRGRLFVSGWGVIRRRWRGRRRRGGRQGSGGCPWRRWGRR